MGFVSGASERTATLSLENLAIVKLSGILLFLEMIIKDKYFSYLCNCLCYIDAAPNLWEGNRDREDSCFVVYGAMSAGKHSWEFKISGNKSYCCPRLSLVCIDMMIIVLYVLQFHLCFHPITMDWLMAFVQYLTLCSKIISVSNIIDLFSASSTAVFLLVSLYLPSQLIACL